jgi:VanZ family protein
MVAFFRIVEIGASDGPLSFHAGRCRQWAAAASLSAHGWRETGPAFRLRTPALPCLMAERPKRRWFPTGQIVHNNLCPWWPALVWAVIIFVVSTDAFSATNTGQILKPILGWLDPETTPEQLEFINFYIRKCAHFTEYFIFYLLVYRGMSGARMFWRSSWAVGAWFIVAAYSVLDEFHQSFTVSRTASPWDSLLDSVAALAALLVIRVWFRFLDAHRAK